MKIKILSSFQPIDIGVLLFVSLGPEDRDEAARTGDYVPEWIVLLLFTLVQSLAQSATGKCQCVFVPKRLFK